MKAGLREGQPVRQLLRAKRSLDSGGTYPNCKIHLEDEASGHSTDLIVERPFVEKSRPCGRSMRVYIAYDLKERRLVVLKDIWHSTFANLRPEAETYRLLRNHDVPNLPNVLYAGDVKDAGGGDQAAKTLDIVQIYKKWDCRKIPHETSVHHRIVQNIAYPLSEALDEKEFVQVIWDVLLTIGKTYECTGLIHRDISLTNIMITPGGQGIFNDWDMVGEDASHVGLGTSFFQSVDILQNPMTKLHEVLDDLESIYWVLYHGASYFPRGDFFDLAHLFDEQGVEGGGAKKAFFTDPPSGDIVASCRSKTLQQLCLDMHQAWRLYYLIPQEDPSYADELKKMRAKYMRVSFWMEKVAAALDQMSNFPSVTYAAKESERDQRKSEPQVKGSPAAGRKKKPAVSDTPLCRSKRVKVHRRIASA